MAKGRRRRRFGYKLMKGFLGRRVARKISRFMFKRRRKAMMKAKRRLRRMRRSRRIRSYHVSRGGVRL